MITWLPQIDSSIVLDSLKSLLLLLSVLIARTVVVRSGRTTRAVILDRADTLSVGNGRSGRVAQVDREGL